MTELMTDKLNTLGERGIISQLVRPLMTEKYGNILLDDCAVFEVGSSSQLLLTTDQGPSKSFMEILDIGTPADLAHFHVTMNVSDIAAMGGIPVGMLLVLALTTNDTVQYLREYLDGVKAAMADYDVCLFGGDTKQAQVRSTTITLIGRASATGILRRDGARPGDLVFITGPRVGTAMSSFVQTARDKSKGIKANIFRPKAQVSAGRELVESGLCTSCMDMSDGLLASAEQLANASQLTFHLNIDGVPFAPSPTGDRIDSWRNLIANVGGDFGLMFTASARGMTVADKIGATLVGTVGTRSGDGLSQTELRDAGISLKAWEQFKTVGSISDELKSFVDT